jgi:GPH family glycoside/pentoside/hexuronide:cation symporter
LFNAILIIVRTITNHSILADIADEHELVSGRRQEGVFFAAAAFASKFVMGFGYMVAGPLLDIVGLEAGVAPGDVPESTLLGIGIIAGPVMMLIYLVPFWMASRLDVSRERLAEVHHELRRRRQSGSPK